MKHDVAFSNQTAPYFPIDAGQLDREFSGPPMVRMALAAFAGGFLFALCLAASGVAGPAASIGIGWSVSIAVLAIESAMFNWSKSSRFAFRCKALAWSTIGATN